MDFSKAKASSTNYTFKLLYIVAIIFVVAGHCENGGISILYEWFSPAAFHLAVFMFASGYFYKTSDEVHPLTSILHKTKRWIIPMYLYNLFYGALVQFSKNFGFSIGEDFTLRNLLLMPWINGHQFVYNMGGWFIAPLFMIYVLNLVFRKLLGKYVNNWFLFFLYCALGITGVKAASLGFSSTGYGLMISRICYFLPFYGFGVLYRSHLENMDKIPSTIYFFLLFAAELIIITKYGYPVAYSPSWCNNFSNPFIPFIVGFIGLLFWLRVCKLLAPILQNANSRLPLEIGNCTYSIMMNQFLGFMLVKTVFSCINVLSSGKIFSGFDHTLYHTDIWYYYTPDGISQWKIVYLLAGILVPILIQQLLNRLKRALTISYRI